MAELRTYTYEYVVACIWLVNKQYGLDSVTRDAYLQSARWNLEATWLTEDERQHRYRLILEACQSYIDRSGITNPVNIMVGVTVETAKAVGKGLQTIGERAIQIGGFVTQPWFVIVLGIALVFFFIYVIAPRIVITKGA